MIQAIIKLGDGSTVISDIRYHEGDAGVVFSCGGQGVGVYPDPQPETTDELDRPFLVITSDNRESLVVLREAVDRAIKTFDVNGGGPAGDKP